MPSDTRPAIQRRPTVRTRRSPPATAIRTAYIFRSPWSEARMASTARPVSSGIATVAIIASAESTNDHTTSRRYGRRKPSSRTKVRIGGSLVEHLNGHAEDVEAHRTRSERVALAALAAVLVAGGLLRGLLMEAWSPAFMGWPDAKSYLDVAHGELFSNVLRPAGYPLFLRSLDGLHAGLGVVVGVNHALGLATAVVLFATVGRLGAPPVLGLVPAAFVALSGDTGFVEHAPLSEPLFTFLVVGAV